MLIGLGHTARVGKDTAASILVRRYDFHQIAFADALKNFTREVFPDVGRIVDKYGWDAAKQDFPGVRQALVDVGNFARRCIGEDVWIRAAFNKIGQHEGARWVVTDVRYPNEAEAISDAGGWLVKITRPGFEPLDNVADQALVGFKGWDHVIYNDGSIEDLAAKLAVLPCVHRLGDL